MPDTSLDPNTLRRAAGRDPRVGYHNAPIRPFRIDRELTFHHCASLPTGCVCVHEVAKKSPEVVPSFAEHRNEGGRNHIAPG